MPDDGKLGDQDFLYDAFISYRHVERDRKWAEWLLTSLEEYHVPKSLQDKGFPRRLRKIFRDEDELPSSADLNDQIRAALTGSRFLIVVCSAFTPRSKWVAREIEFFNELGRDNQVLALLTEGEPADSFPDGMLVRIREVVDPDGTKRIVREDKEPLAADVRPRSGVSAETSKRLALLRLVAVILGVKFDDLRQREHQRERKRHLTWMAIAAALVLVIGGSGGFYWNLIRPTTAYFRQVVWRWGAPEGAYPINAATYSSLPTSYSVVTQWGKIVEIRYRGWRPADPEGHSRWVLHYGDDGKPRAIDVYGAGDRLIDTEVLTREGSGDKILVSFERYGNSVGQDSSQALVTDTGNIAAAATQTKTKITRHELTLDTNGLATEVRYQDNWGVAQTNAQGSFGAHLSYSPEGRVLRRAEIGPDGDEITLKNGVHAVVTDYDQFGNVSQVTLLGENGQPIVGPDGYARFTREYDLLGIGISQQYYGAGGKPTMSGSGYSKFVAKHDERGDVTGVEFYNADGKLAPTKDGYAIVKRKFDDNLNLLEETYFNANNQPTLDKLGRAGAHQQFDQHRSIVEADYTGVDGKLTISTQGFAKLTRTLDDHGNITGESYFGVDGRLMIGSGAYSSYRAEFDKHDHRTRFDYFGIDGKPTLSNEAIAEYRYTYDGRGNEIKREFFGVDGKPALIMGRGAVGSGYAGYRQDYDERGNIIETDYFGVNGEPALNSAYAAAKTHFAYDDRGNSIQMDVFGVDGKPTLATGGFATLRLTYNAFGYSTGGARYGIHGEPIANAQGVARTASKYDARGNLIERTLTGLDGKPAMDAGGYAGFRVQYDDRGDQTEAVYFGPDGAPVLTSQGYAIFRQKFDDHRNLLETRYLDTDGKPILTKEDIATATYAYDALGHEIERSFFGFDGKPTLGASGFATYRQAFDVRGNQVMKAYYGVDGNPIAIKDGGYAKVVWQYDARNDLIEESFFGVDGQPAHDDGGVTIKYSYDDLGRLTKTAYFDAQGNELHMELVVARVIPGGNGAQAGLAAGDHILRYNGRDVGSLKQLNTLSAESGYPFRTVTVRRGSQILNLEVINGPLGAYTDLARVEPAKSEAESPLPAPSR
jgi:YD repeat-containing protein